MGESVQLLKMKQYALNRLSSREEFTVTNASINSNGQTYETLKSRGERSAYETLKIQGEKSPTSYSTTNQNNGFIGNKEYGDWDSTLSPTREDESHSAPSTLPRQPARSRPSGTKPAQKFIPEHEIDIPADGSLRDFSADDMSTFLRYMGVEERIVTHTHKKGLDGHKFSKLKDSDLEALSMKNPIICHFRDKSGSKEKGGKKKAPFML